MNFSFLLKKLPSLNLAILVFCSMSGGGIFGDDILRFTLPVDFQLAEKAPVYVRGLSQEILHPLFASKYKEPPLARDCHYVTRRQAPALANFRFLISNKRAFGALLSVIGRLGTTDTYADLIQVGARYFTRSDDEMEFVTGVLTGKISGFYLRSAVPSVRFQNYLVLWERRKTLEIALQNKGYWERAALEHLLTMGAQHLPVEEENDRREVIALLQRLHDTLPPSVWTDPVFEEEALKPRNRNYYYPRLDWWPCAPSNMNNALPRN
jgi:hypothetical protein